jgi:hypothetical protein
VGWIVAANGAEYFIVSDPIYKETTILVGDFAAAYQAGGVWTHAYLTAPQPHGQSVDGGVILESSRRQTKTDRELMGS